MIVNLYALGFIVIGSGSNKGTALPLRSSRTSAIEVTD